MEISRKLRERIKPGDTKTEPWPAVGVRPIMEVIMAGLRSAIPGTAHEVTGSPTPSRPQTLLGAVRTENRTICMTRTYEHFRPVPPPPLSPGHCSPSSEAGVGIPDGLSPTCSH